MTRDVPSAAPQDVSAKRYVEAHSARTANPDGTCHAIAGEAITATYPHSRVQVLRPQVKREVNIPHRLLPRQVLRLRRDRLRHYEQPHGHADHGHALHRAAA